ncbi:anhydro-N-acetylmuramic acid kinase [Orbaceae bacterium ac157xtp]
MQRQSSLYIGIMSGTSLDGVDIALVNITPDKMTLLNSECYLMPDELKNRLLAICQNKQVELQTLGEVDHQLGLLYADCVNDFLTKNNINHKQIVAIGCHGQTIYHSPIGKNPFTMQIGDANIIATKTNITTIADFRRKDMALGGQGAPLVPAFHQATFKDDRKNRVILNIGGISNITVIAPNRPIIGYDTGPGNVLLDSWINLHLNKPYDKDANWAKKGNVNSQLLAHMLTENYFKLSFPKSTGRELFNLAWLKQYITGYSISPEDVQATLIELTAQATVNELNKLDFDPLPCELLVCGGGAKNPLIITSFQRLLPHWAVNTTDSQGISSEFMEAMAFAWLAYCRIHNLPSNIPSVTGATKAVPLGVIYPAV